ncbi:hypothetical protein KVE83_07655 [Helicobacter pylori]|nr:hypothetical protein KVE83_07655 [Helicobacter pylori]
MKTEKEVQKQVIETFKSMGYAYLGDLTKSDNENINKESLKAWLKLKTKKSMMKGGIKLSRKSITL